jgi:hypothetical protein
MFVTIIITTSHGEKAAVLLRHWGGSLSPATTAFFLYATAKAMVLMVGATHFYSQCCYVCL